MADLILKENVYNPTYDIAYDWEAVILDDESVDIDSPSDEDEEEFIPELWLPGSTEIGEA